jgi:hypothetical protein
MHDEWRPWSQLLSGEDGVMRPAADNPIQCKIFGSDALAPFIRDK